MEGGAWWAVVHGVTKSQTQLSDFTFTFHFPALEKEMATHSSVLAWRIPGMEEPDGLPSMGSHRVRHDWSDLAAAVALLKGESQWITGIYFLVIQKFSVRICWHIFFRKQHSIVVKRKYFRQSNPPFSFQTWFTICVALCGCLTFLCLSILSCKVEKMIVSACRILLRIA